MTNIPSWALVDAGECSNCSHPTALYTHSLAYLYSIPDIRDNIYLRSPENKQVMCFQCHKDAIASVYRHLDSDNPIRDELSVLHRVHDQTYRDCEFINSIPKCYACDLLMPDSTAVEAVLQNDPSVTVRAHARCTIIVQCCDNRYPSRHWAHTAPSNTLLRVYNIDGDERCAMCTDNYLSERGETLDDYYECPCCNRYVDRDYTSNWRGEIYCDTCINNNVYTCSDCDTQLWDGDDHDCYDEDYTDGVIHDYSHKPRPYFFGKKPSERIYMGFELEVEVYGGDRYEHAEKVQNSLGERVYLKHDGSLECGFEIVTHPHSLESYRKEFSWESFAQFRKDGLRSWNTSTCGLHVHVSRDAFGVPYDNRTDNFSQHIRSRQAHELRFIKLIYDNERQVCRLAGRHSDSYANFADKRNLTNKVFRGRDVGGRHAAVNTYNESTLEVRIFKGSLKHERVLMALEFVHSTVEYTRDLKVNGKNHALSWLAFAGYVHTNQEQYPNLYAFMAKSLETDTPTE